jgi:lysophospholipase L1-like esterase
LIDPFFISADRMRGSYRAKVLRALPAYIEIVHALSKKYRARLVETHALFQKHLRYQSWDTYCPEPVHPNTVGHMVIAEAVYAALSAK